MTHKKLAAHKQPLGIAAHPEPLGLPVHKIPLMVGASADAALVSGVVPAATASMRWGVFATILGLALVVAGFLFFVGHDRFNEKKPLLTGAQWQKAVDGETIGMYGLSGDKVAKSTAVYNDVASGRDASGKLSAGHTDASEAGGDAIDKVVYLFAYDSAGVPESATLNKVVDRAKAMGETVTVKAYTDATGNADYNRKLSERRAKAIGDYLIAHGVPASRVNTIGMGPTNAFSDNAHDRRAEITFD